MAGLFACAGTDRDQRVEIMEVLSEKVEQGVVERRFDLQVGDRDRAGHPLVPRGGDGAPTRRS